MNYFIMAIKLNTGKSPKYFSRLSKGLMQPHRRCAGLRRYCNNYCSVKSDHCSGTMIDVVKNIREAVGLERGYDSIPKCRSHLLKYQPNSEDLPDRSMKETFTTAVLPLEGDSIMQERYLWDRDNLRLGRIMEDLDMFAVWICHRHVHIPSLPKGIPLPYTFVTRFVDKVEFVDTNLMKVDKDIQFSGFVSWTGHTSMEIIIYVRQSDLIIAKAIIVMVARNATNTSSAPVNSLKPANELEERCWKMAQKRQESRKQTQKESVFNVKPTKFEDGLIYDVFHRTNLKGQLHLNQAVLPEKSRWMAKSYNTTTIHTFPENRNAQNTIFGGYIMRVAVETSYTMASMYSKGRPLLQTISDICFLKPVHLNSFLKMTAYVAYTTPSHIMIMTVADILNAHTFERTITNAFYFTFKHTGEQPLDAVLPYSYHETLVYIKGRRKMMAFEDQLNRSGQLNI